MKIDFDTFGNEICKLLNTDQAKHAYLFEENNDGLRERVKRMTATLMGGFLKSNDAEFLGWQIVSDETNGNVDHAPVMYVDVLYVISHEERQGYRFTFNMAVGNATWSKV